MQRKVDGTASSLKKETYSKANSNCGTNFKAWEQSVDVSEKLYGAATC